MLKQMVADIAQEGGRERLIRFFWDHLSAGTAAAVEGVEFRTLVSMDQVLCIEVCTHLASLTNAAEDASALVGDKLDAQVAIVRAALRLAVQQLERKLSKKGDFELADHKQGGETVTYVEQEEEEQEEEAEEEEDRLATAVKGVEAVLQLSAATLTPVRSSRTGACIMSKLISPVLQAGFIPASLALLGVSVSEQDDDDEEWLTESKTDHTGLQDVENEATLTFDLRVGQEGDFRAHAEDQPQAKVGEVGADTGRESETEDVAEVWTLLWRALNISCSLWRYLETRERTRQEQERQRQELHEQTMKHKQEQETDETLGEEKEVESGGQGHVQDQDQGCEEDERIKEDESRRSLHQKQMATLSSLVFYGLETLRHLSTSMFIFAEQEQESTEGTEGETLRGAMEWYHCHAKSSRLGLVLEFLGLCHDHPLVRWFYRDPSLAMHRSSKFSYKVNKRDCCPLSRCN